MKRQLYPPMNPAEFIGPSFACTSISAKPKAVEPPRGSEQAARQLAYDTHGHQVDKLGRPYMEHIEAVVAMTRCLGEDAVIAAWLHDTVEDSDLKLGDLVEDGFSPRVVELVDRLTRRAAIGHSPRESYYGYIARCAVDPLAARIKLADNLHNSFEPRLAMLEPASRKFCAIRYGTAYEMLISAIRRHEQEGN